jgi:hypothetical protein
MTLVNNYVPGQGPGLGNRPGPRYPRAVCLKPAPIYTRALGLVAGYRAVAGRAWSPLGTAASGSATPRAAPVAARVVSGVAGGRSVVHDRNRGATWALARRRGCRWTGPARPT